MNSYGLAALVPLVITHISLPIDATGATGAWGSGTKAITAANFHIEVPELDPKNLFEWAEQFLNSLSSLVSNMVTWKQNARRSKSRGTKKSCSGK